jgi:peptide/nickel transport system ATP-binding protein
VGEGRATAGADGAGAALVEVDGLCLRYGPRGRFANLLGRPGPLVVREASFSIRPGETFALVGESGSGKSTIARAVSGLLPPVAGEIRFAGKPLPGSIRERDGELKRRIQYIFQNPDASLNPRSRVSEILTRPLAVYLGLSGEPARAKAEDSLREVRLEAGYLARFPDQLSGGERQRVAIARALVAEPSLLLCDEVLSALDVSVQANVLDVLRALKRETGVAMLFIAHDLAVVRSLADRVGVLFRGTLFETGTVAEVFNPPFHPYTHELLMAVPSPHVRKRRAMTRRDAEAKGTTGCPYAGRCPWQAGSLCEREPPPWREAGGSLRIRCHLPLEDLAARAEWNPAVGSEAAGAAAS